MPATTAQQMRAWTGPAILTYGPRPFFFGAGVWATVAMVLWIPMLTGHLTLPTAFDPVSWHAHEFLYGYLGAVIAGFVLTAVPNWTGRLPIVGWRLGALALLWLLGRIVIAVSAGMPPLLVAAIDLAFPVVFAATIAREIVAGKTWRNLVVLGLLAMFTTGNLLFHWEAAQGANAANGAGLRLGLGTAVMLIAVIGGRLVPSFTRNWLVKRGASLLPAPPMQRFDKLALLVLLAALILWLISPRHPATGGALLLAGLLHLVRLARWAGHRTLADPLVAVLHAGYACLPLGALALATSIFAPGWLGAAAAQHLWMAGAIGVMTLAVMMRTILTHTGQPLHAGRLAVAIHIALVLSVSTRVAASLWPEVASLLFAVSGLLWIAAFGGFAVGFGRLLLRRSPRPLR